MPALNAAQIEVLKILEFAQTDTDLKRLKEVLIQYLFERSVALADQAWEERGYTNETVEEWRNENMRVKSKAIIKNRA